MTRHGPIVMYFSGLNRQMHHKCIILGKILGFCPPWLLSAWILSSMGFCPHWILSPWVFVLLGFCPLGYCPMGFCPVGFCPRTVPGTMQNISGVS